MIVRQTHSPDPQQFTGGWEVEHAALRDALDRLQSGQSQTACLLFEAGEDHFHDALLEEIERDSRDQGATVFTASGRRLRQYPYQPLVEIIRQLSEHVDLTTPEYEPFLAVLGQIVPEVPPPRSPLPHLPKQEEAVRFRTRLVDFFLETARESPLVFCFKELQYVGLETIEIIRALLRSGEAIQRQKSSQPTPPVSLLIVGGFSDPQQEVDGQHELTQTLSVLRELAEEPEGTHVQLSPWSQERLAERLKETSPQFEKQQDLVHKLYELSDGAPRLVEEFIRHLRPANSPANQERPIDENQLLDLPRTVADSLLERFEFLSPAAREVLEILAAAHGPLSRAELTAALLTPDGAAESTTRNADEIDSWTSLLEREGFIAAHSATDELALDPPGFGEHIYRTLSDHRRWSLHRRLADSLLAQNSSRAPCRVPEALVFHAWLGERPDIFCEKALQAAARFQAVHADFAAIQLYERVLDHLATWSPGTVSESGDTNDASLSTVESSESLHRLVNERLATAYVDSQQSRRALERLTILSSLYDRDTSPCELASVYRRLGEIYLQKEEDANAFFFLEKALSTLLE